MTAVDFDKKVYTMIQDKITNLSKRTMKYAMDSSIRSNVSYSQATEQEVSYLKVSHKVMVLKVIQNTLPMNTSNDEDLKKKLIENLTEKINIQKDRMKMMDSANMNAYMPAQNVHDTYMEVRRMVKKL